MLDVAPLQRRKRLRSEPHLAKLRLHRVLTNITARRLYEIAARDDLKKKGYTDISMRLGNTLTYTASKEKDLLRVTPHLKYLEDQASGGPILPLWIQGFFFRFRCWES